MQAGYNQKFFLSADPVTEPQDLLAKAKVHLSGLCLPSWLIYGDPLERYLLNPCSAQSLEVQ
jgi:hypothetical protein